MFPARLGPLVATLMGLLAVGALVYMFGVRAHVWPSPSTGFWVF
jgi:hypothetical protein